MEAKVVTRGKTETVQLQFVADEFFSVCITMDCRNESELNFLHELARRWNAGELPPEFDGSVHWPPAEITEAARKVSGWFAERHITEWKLDGCRNRADDVFRQANEPGIEAIVRGFKR